MKKLILSLLLAVFTCTLASAAGWQELKYKGWDLGEWGKKNIALEQLRTFRGLTFFKNFKRRGTFADFALGKMTGTYTCTRSATAPATYIDGTGVVHKTIVSDIPLFSGGYYDATGFQSVNQGYMAERASTNLVIRTDGTA